MVYNAREEDYEWYIIQKGEIFSLSGVVHARDVCSMQNYSEKERGMQ